MEKQGFSFVKFERAKKPQETNQTWTLFLIQIPPEIVLACFLACEPTMGMGWIFHGSMEVQLAVFWAWYFLHFSPQLISLLGICDLSQFRGGFTLKVKLCDHPHSYNSHSGRQVQQIHREKHQPCRADPWVMLRLALLHLAPATGWGKWNLCQFLHHVKSNLCHFLHQVAPVSHHAPPSLGEPPSEGSHLSASAEQSDPA